MSEPLIDEQIKAAAREAIARTSFGASITSCSFVKRGGHLYLRIATKESFPKGCASGANEACTALRHTFPHAYLTSGGPFNFTLRLNPIQPLHK